MKVKELMTTDVASCKPHCNLGEVAKLMWDYDCGIVPIVNEEGRVLGVITDRDICIALATMNRNASDVPAGELKTDQVFTCAPEDSVDSAMQTMRAERIRRLPVVDDLGRLRGLLSLNDLALGAARPKGGKGNGALGGKVLATVKGICGHRKKPAIRRMAAGAADGEC